MLKSNLRCQSSTKNLSNAHAKATAAIAHAGEQTLNAHCFADATALNDVGASLPKTF